MTAKRLSTDDGIQPCVCVYGPCLLHAGHCCFRSAASTCHESEIVAALPELDVSE